MQILLVEDDAMLAQAVGDGVRQQGWELDWVANAGAAKTMLVDHDYNAVLLDLHLPGSSGLSVLTALRERYDTTPVLIITARDQLSERVRGLDAGADDYVVKPFQFDELYARLRAVLRRSQGRVAPLLSCGELQLDPSRREVTFRGQPAALSLHEYRTLLALMERKGRPVTRSQLEDAVYGGNGHIESNTIAVYIHQLRRKFGEELVITVPGLGYQLGEACA